MTDLEQMAPAGLIAEVLRLRAKNSELNRRCQEAEAAARQTAEACRQKGTSFGRLLANWAASDQHSRAEALAARVAELEAEVKGLRENTS